MGDGFSTKQKLGMVQAICESLSKEGHLIGWVHVKLFIKHYGDMKSVSKWSKEIQIGYVPDLIFMDGKFNSYPNQHRDPIRSDYIFVVPSLHG